MLTLEGRVLSVIRHTARTDRDGKAREAYSQVQLQVEELLDAGQVRYGIQTMTTGTPDAFEAVAGQLVAVPVRAYVRAGTVALTMPPEAEPRVVLPLRPGLATAAG